jgi:BirA family biotin operon repressor/biotin-[acetyl-CoA-carboxylase] ligase
LGSTNDRAVVLAADGADDLTTVVAKRQTAGRGRQGRSWQSPEGNLYVSIVNRVERPLQELVQLSLVSAIAVGRALTPLLSGDRALTYKWPNDILVDGAKISGILSETYRSQKRQGVVVGIGINVAVFPRDTSYPATSLARLGVEVGVEPVLSSLLAEFAAARDRWLAGGFGGIREEWLARAHGRGGPVRVGLGHETVEGVFLDLDAHGGIRVRIADGRLRTVAAGELRFG